MAVDTASRDIAPLSQTDPGITLSNGCCSVTVHPRVGMLITSFRENAEGVDAIWTQGHPHPWPAELGPGGSPSTPTFLDNFVGGWFPMIPHVGFPAADDPSTHLHGTAARVVWDVIEITPRSLAARVQLPGGMSVRRVVDLGPGASVNVATTVTNAGPDGVSFSWGEHPCLSLGVFADGALLAAPTNTRIPIPPMDPANASVESDGELTWPHATLKSSKPLDLSGVGDPGWRGHDHIALDLPSGAVVLTAPRHGRLLRMDWNWSQWPHALVWRRHVDPDLDSGVIALEPSSVAGRGTTERDPSPVLDGRQVVQSWITLTWAAFVVPHEKERRG